MEKEKFDNEPEKLIDPKPRLENIYKTLGLLEGYTEWKKDLPEKIGPWKNSLELFNNIQKAVLSQVENKTLAFRDKIPSISEISDENIIDALINNWFEDLPETRGQRREVLLAVAAHVVRHMETKAYQSVLVAADKYKLEKLGLNPELREVAIKALDACMESDLLFIRFLAFSGLSGKPSEEASPSQWYLPNDKTPRTINTLFPREAQYIARKFKEISEMPINWNNFPGGETFKKYLSILAASYSEVDINKIGDYHEKVKKLYSESALSDFPILIIPSEYGWGYLKPPYYDPELRVCLKSPECIEAEKGLVLSQQIMADCLKNEGYPDLSKNLMSKKIKVVNSIGDYGVNLHSKATAQAGDPIIVIYLGEQIKVHNMMSERKKIKIENLPEKQSQMMSFFVTLLHEFGHCHKNDDPAFKRLGAKQSIVIDEVAAEQIYRWFLPEIIKREGLKGTEEQWAAAALDLSMEELWDKSEDDHYYYAAVHTLNRIIKEGVVEFDFKTRTLSIKDIDAFYEIQEELSKEVLGLYEDKFMNPSKAAKWIKENCRPNEIVQKISNFVKKEDINPVKESDETGPWKVFPWEVAWIKKPDPNNPDDVKAIKRIDAQPAVEKWMVGPALTKKDFLEENFYSVCREKSKDRMEGFVWLYDTDTEIVDKLIERKLADFSKDTRVLEISFARYVDPDLPVENQERGLISSAIRQICFSLIEKQEKIVIVAFTNPKNLPAEGVLKNAGFVIKGKIPYNKESPEEDNFWILDKNELEKILKRKKTQGLR